MLQPADIAVEEGAEVVHPVFQHSEAVDTRAERKALPLVGVEPHVRDYTRVDHAAAEHFHPVVRPADYAATVLPRPTDLHVSRRLGEREIAREHADADVVPLEKCLEEGLERPL